MSRDLLELLEALTRGERTAAEVLERLRHLPFEDIGIARIDHHRSIRRGRPEVVLASHKSVEQVLAIVDRLVAAEGRFLCTRVSEPQAEALLERFPGAAWNSLGRTVWLGPMTGPARGSAAVVCAGTSDLPVAEEAASVLEACGARVTRVTDVGVAGIHRVLAARETFEGAEVLIVVAGMEGALPSVVAGLVQTPVIAVPTSVGYGASFGGLAALLAMLNSCADGVTVVNIDNGFGAAMAAVRILDALGAGER